MDALDAFKLCTFSHAHDEPLDNIVRRIAASELHGLDGLVELRIIPSEGQPAPAVYSVHLGSSHPEITTGHAREPTLVISTKERVFRDIVAGSHSPLRALAEGHLHFKGDASLAKRLIVHLTPKDITPFFKPTLNSKASWISNNLNDGALTVSGICFTPNGGVTATFNFFGDQFRTFGQADANGTVTITQTGIPCDRDGASVGVDVNAHDLLSDQVTDVVNYKTPCNASY